MEQDVGDPKMHRTMHQNDCPAYPWRRHRHGPRPIERIQKRRAEENAQKEQARIHKVRMMMELISKQDVEVSIESVLDPFRNCACDLMLLYQERLSQGVIRFAKEYAPRRRKIKLSQFRMLGKPCDAHELRCEKCHHALVDADWPESREMRVEDMSTSPEMRRGHGVVNIESRRSFTSTEPLKPSRHFSTDLSPRPTSAAESTKACRTCKTLPKSAGKQKVQHGRETLAHNILRAAGVHPWLPSGNAHLRALEDAECRMSDMKI
ncbi:MAG: hypothetical protein Q9191_006179 [Dirinaria sp. TL-2023a]